MFGEELPVVQSGFLSTTEMVGALSDTLYLRPMAGDEGNHWVVMDIQNAPGHTTPQQPGLLHSSGFNLGSDYTITNPQMNHQGGKQISDLRSVVRGKYLAHTQHLSTLFLAI